MRNEEVLKTICQRWIIPETIKKLKRNWLGHWMCKDCILRDGIEDMVEGEE